jgi:hypothetical protein
MAIKMLESMALPSGAAEARVTAMLRPLRQHLCKMLLFEADPDRDKNWCDEITFNYLDPILEFANGVKTKKGHLSKDTLKKVWSAAFNRLGDDCYVLFHNKGYKELRNVVKTKSGATELGKLAASQFQQDVDAIAKLSILKENDGLIVACIEIMEVLAHRVHEIRRIHSTH